jgi:glycosyltransferase involved in cell wall biosynthesis
LWRGRVGASAPGHVGMTPRRALRVALLTPLAAPSPSGNAVTVQRIASGLSTRGIEPRVWDLSAADASTVEREVRRWKPGLVHAFHAFHSGPLGARICRLLGLPLVVTLTGTDANHDLSDPKRGPTVREALEAAAAITVFHHSVAERISAALPELAGRVTVIAQSVSFPSVEGPAPPPAMGPVILFPAGIRPVKRPRMPLEPLDAVAARHPGLELRYVGPILDAEEGEELFREMARRPWCRYLGAVPHGRMPLLLDAADIVLNCSVSEGGMPNSVLEALALGRAMLASDIEGNRSLIEDGVTGLLFSDASELALKAERLLSDGALRARLGAQGRVRAAAFRPETEIDGYVRLFDTLVHAP